MAGARKRIGKSAASLHRGAAAARFADQCSRNTTGQ